MTFRKCIAAFLIVALSHYFLGCSIYKETREDDFYMLSKSRSDITGVVLLSGQILRFDKSGKIVGLEEGISGSSIEGNRIYHPLNLIQMMYRSGSQDSVTKKELVKDSSIRISKLITLNNKEVVFSPEGGIYLPAHFIVKGVTESGRNIEISTDEIQYALENSLDGFAILKNIAGLAFIALLVFLILRVSGWSLNEPQLRLKLSGSLEKTDLIQQVESEFRGD